MSTYIQKMRARLKEKSGELDAIIKAAEDEARPLTVEENESVEKIGADVAEIEKSIKVAEAQEQRKAQYSEPSNTDLDDLGGEPQRRAPAEPAKPLTAVQKMGLIAMASAEAEFCRKDHDYKSPLAILEERGFARLAEDADRYKKRKTEFMRTLNVSTNISGGFLSPDNQASDIIELLYPETTFLQGGPRRVAMPNGTYRQPAGASGSTASYRQEGGQTAVTEPTFREVAMSSKFLGAIVPMTREMIDFTLPGAEMFVEQDLREAMAQKVDSKGYYGAQASGEPLGIFNHTGISSVTVQGTTTATLAQIDGTFEDLHLGMLNNNIRSGRFAYIMAPRTWKYLSNKRVGTNDGEYAYPSLRGTNPTFDGFPVLVSTNIPINLDTSGNGNGDESDLALVNFSDVLFGVQGDMAFATSSEATIEINSAQVSAFQNNLVFLRALSAHDIGLRRPESVVLCRSVRWGA